jgi:hypothetical protein
MMRGKSHKENECETSHISCRAFQCGAMVPAAAPHLLSRFSPFPPCTTIQAALPPLLHFFSCLATLFTLFSSCKPHTDFMVGRSFPSHLSPGVGRMSGQSFPTVARPTYWRGSAFFKHQQDDSITSVK